MTQTTITWTRGGSSPQFARVTFEFSTDNVNYTLLGNGTRVRQQLDPDRFEPPNRTEHLHPRSRLLSQRLLQRLGEHHGICPECVSCRNPATLGNISTRVSVQTGDNVLIGGFIVTGTQPKKVIVRAIGPSLPVAGKLGESDARASRSRGKTDYLSNDNWRTRRNRQEIIDSTSRRRTILESAIPPPHASREQHWLQRDRARGERRDRNWSRSRCMTWLSER